MMKSERALRTNRTSKRALLVYCEVSQRLIGRETEVCQDGYMPDESIKDYARQAHRSSFFNRIDLKFV
jgi:hypothetical protein